MTPPDVSPVLYGIPNCETVKKARQWLDRHGIAYRFHDFRKDGLQRDLLDAWCSHLPWDSLLNRRGTTWRQLPEADRLAITDQQTALELMLRKPTVIKRPVLSIGPRLLVGFSDALYTSQLADGQ